METYRLEAINLKRQAYKENDSLAVFFTRELGKISLVVRGTRKSSSKLAGHIEPIILSSVMAIKSRHIDYAGSVFANNCYLNIKNDFYKLEIAGKAINIFDKLVKEGDPDDNIYNLLISFLNIFNESNLNSNKYKIIYNIFILKLLSFLGYQAELHRCVVCKRIVNSENKLFSISKGGLVCSHCDQKDCLIISDESIDMLRFFEKEDLEKYSKFKIGDNYYHEIDNITTLYLNYYG